MPVKVFINYRRGPNLREAQHLATLLSAAFGKASVFLDLRGIGGAENWLERLQSQVDACDAMVCLIGKGWADVSDENGRRLEDANDPLVHEIGRALVKRMPVLPLLIDGASMPDISSLPKGLWVLTLQHAMPLRNESFARDADDIIETLRRRLKEQRKGGVPAWALGTASAALVATSAMSGPWLVSKAGLPFLGVDVVARQQVDALRSEAVDAQMKLTAANTALRGAGDERRDAVEAAVSKERQAGDQRQAAAVTKAREEAQKPAQDATRTAEARRLKELAEQKAQHDTALTKERQAVAAAISTAVAKEKQEAEQRLAKAVSEHQATQARHAKALADQRAEFDAALAKERQSAQQKLAPSRQPEGSPTTGPQVKEATGLIAAPGTKIFDNRACRLMLSNSGNTHIPISTKASGTPTPKGAKMLDELADKLRACPNAMALLWGHSDTKSITGNDIALAHASNVERYLISRGVPSQQLVAHGREKAQKPYRLATDVVIELTLADDPANSAPDPTKAVLPRR